MQMQAVHVRRREDGPGGPLAAVGQRSEGVNQIASTGLVCPCKQQQHHHQQQQDHQQQQARGA